jgi:hypothetical protein
MHPFRAISFSQCCKIIVRSGMGMSQRQVFPVVPDYEAPPIQPEQPKAMAMSQWMPSLVGHNARFCLTLIPLLSIGPLACLLAALREGAPSSPGLAGAVAGLGASGIAATFFAANCTDDSALFLITWYLMPCRSGLSF